MNTKFKYLYWILALLVAGSFDLMFWQKPGGMNFFIFIVLIVLGVLIPLWLEKVQIPLTSYLLLLPIGFFAVMTFFRSEPYTNFTNGLIVFCCLIIFAITLRNGAWPEMNLRDYFAQFLKFLLNCITGGILFFIKVKKEKEMEDPSSESPDTPKKATGAASAIRGILLAIPIVIILTLLLTSADPIFANRVRGLFDWFSFDNLGEYLFRLTYILIFAYIILSAYFYGSWRSDSWKKGHHVKPVIKPFLGITESGIILGAVNLLFLVFVILQFTYLFGGQENISIEGFTYAEYARRGFFELLAVAIISLIMFYVLSVWTKRETTTQRLVFSGMGLLLVVLVGVILVSSFTRMSLYEEAYGFTRLRTVTHIFTIWTGLVMTVTAFLEIRQKLDKLGFLLIMLVFLFGLTLNAFNIDRFIVRKNISRAVEKIDQDGFPELDAAFLTTLSNDAIPQLVTYYNDPSIPDLLHDRIGGVLACRLATLDETENTPITSTHFSREKAIQLLNELQESINRYPVTSDNGWLSVNVNGEDFYCDGNGWMD